MVMVMVMVVVVMMVVKAAPMVMMVVVMMVMKLRHLDRCVASVWRAGGAGVVRDQGVQRVGDRIKQL
jgi:hypothetical protein